MNSAATRVTLVLVSLGALAACGEPVTVSVGQLGDAIDLTRCVGDDLVCDLERAFEAPSATAPIEDWVSDCVPSEEPAWHLAWIRPVDTLPCNEGPCEPQQLEFAADGSIWTAAATVDAGQARLLLGHYGADGTPLLEQAVETWAVPNHPDLQLEISLASDSQSHALVALSWQLEAGSARAGWIAGYDRAGRRLAGPVSFEGLKADDRLRLRIGARDDVLLLAGNYSPIREGRMVLLDASLRGQWVQSSTFPAATNVMVDEALGPVVVTNVGRAGGVSQFGFRWYDWQGNVRSSLTLPSLTQYVPTSPNDAVISMQPSYTLPAAFREVGRDGQVHWAIRIVMDPVFEDFDKSFSEFSSQQLDSDRVLYRFVHRQSSSGPPLIRDALFRLDPAASICSFARIDESQLVIESFFINPRDDFYVDAHTAQSGRRVIGKLAR